MPDTIRVNPHLSIPGHELDVSFVRASGPGGQNVNKVATAVQLRFDVARSPSLPPAVRQRLMHLAGQRLTLEGVLIIKANRYRTQDRNRDDAIARLIELVRAAAVAPKPRKKTRVPLSAQRQRLDGKQQRGRLKSARSKHRVLDE